MDSAPPTKKPRLGGPLFPDGEVRREIALPPLHRPHINATEGDNTKQAPADQVPSRAHGPFLEDDSDEETSTTAASTTENQPARLERSHAAKLRDAIQFFKDKTEGQTGRVNRAALQQAIASCASAAAEKRFGGSDARESSKLRHLAEIKFLAQDTGMTGDEIEVWVKSAVPYLKEWKLHVIDDPRQRKGLLAILGPNFIKSAKVAAGVANLCVDESLDVLSCETKDLNISCRCARAASQIVLHGKAAGGLTDTSRPRFDLWRHECAVRLLIAVAAEFLARPDGYFVHLLGCPMPHMHVSMKKRAGVAWG